MMNRKKRKYSGASEQYKYRKFTITISKELDVFLDKLRLAVKENSGTRLSRTEIIRVSLNTLKSIFEKGQGKKLEIKGIKDEQDLLEQFKKHIK